MGRKNSLAKNSIQMLCVMQHLDEQNLYERSKLLLSIYRNVCWTACDRAAMLREEAEYCYGRELEAGLLYLNDFAPTVEREKFEMQYQEYDLKRARNIVNPKTGEKMTIPSREDSYERLQEMAVQFPEENRSVEDQILKKIECEQLHKFLLELSKEEQWLIQELYFEERTEREVASVLGLSQKAINKRRQKILEKLRKLF